MAGNPPPVLDTSKIYHATHAEVIASQQRAAVNQANKALYQKKLLNPMNGLQEGGHVFDPAMQRFMSMKVSHGDHYRYNIRNGWSFLWMTVIPIFALYKYFNYEHNKREHDFRTGALPYSERMWKID